MSLDAITTRYCTAGQRHNRATDVPGALPLKDDIFITLIA